MRSISRACHHVRRQDKTIHPTRNDAERSGLYDGPGFLQSTLSIWRDGHESTFCREKEGRGYVWMSRNVCTKPSTLDGFLELTCAITQTSIAEFWLLSPQCLFCINYRVLRLFSDGFVIETRELCLWTCAYITAHDCCYEKGSRKISPYPSLLPNNGPCTLVGLCCRGHPLDFDPSL